MKSVQMVIDIAQWEMMEKAVKVGFSIFRGMLPALEVALKSGLSLPRESVQWSGFIRLDFFKWRDGNLKRQRR